MYSLLIDTHDTKVSFVVFKDYKVLDVIDIESNMRHSEIAMPNLVHILDKNDIDISDIDEYYVVTGPGSFTGVRIGVVIAKTLAYLQNKPIRPINSLDLVAFSTEKIIPGCYLVPEKNGFFVGDYDENGLIDSSLKYISRKEYEDTRSDTKYIDRNIVNYSNVIFHACKLKPVNPHLVNPLYVKQIEAMKW